MAVQGLLEMLGIHVDYFSGFPLRMCTTGQSQYQSIGAQGLEGRERTRQCGPQLFFVEASSCGWMGYDYVFMQWKQQYGSTLSLQDRWKLYQLLWLDITYASYVFVLAWHRIFTTVQTTSIRKCKHKPNQR